VSFLWVERKGHEERPRVAFSLVHANSRNVPYEAEGAVSVRIACCAYSVAQQYLTRQLPAHLLHKQPWDWPPQPSANQKAPAIPLKTPLLRRAAAQTTAATGGNQHGHPKCIDTRQALLYSAIGHSLDKASCMKDKRNIKTTQTTPGASPTPPID
jgi:hypothetical protein